MKWKPRRAALAGAFLTLALALAACGGSPAASAPTAAPAEATAAPAEATAAPAEATAAPAEATAAPAEATAAPAEATAAPVAATKLNLNEVSGDELLAAIPGFGNRMVREFMEYRPYVSIQQFRREIGKYVDDAQVAEYEQYVYVPIDINEADAATIQQIPGVDAAAAEQLVAGRPYADSAAFLARLAELAPGAETAGAAYLAQ